MAESSSALLALSSAECRLQPYNRTEKPIYFHHWGRFRPPTCWFSSGSFFFSSDSGSEMAKVPIGSLFFLIQKRFLQTPAKAAAAIETLSPSSPPPQCEDSNFTVKFLLESCGFPLESAISTSKRLKLNEKKLEQYQSVVDLFRSQGFNQTQIAKVIGQRPKFLQYRAEEILKPKFDFLKENGFLGEFLLEIIMKNSTILEMSLDYNMKQHLEILKYHLASREKIIAAVRKSPRLLTCELKGKVDFLTKEGVSFVGIAKVLVWLRCPLLQKHNKMVYAVNAVKNLGLEPSSPMFLRVFHVMVNKSESALKKKMEVFRNLGWTTEEILSAFKTFPNCLAMSEENIRTTMDFYVNTVNLDLQSVVRNPCILGFGINSRLRPRYKVFMILESKKLIQMNIAPSWFQISDKDFLLKYVIKYKDQVPGLLDIYGAHKNINTQKISKICS